MSEIRRFIDLQKGLKSPPEHYVLADETGSVICSVGTSEEDPAGVIETAVRSDLAFSTGTQIYTLMSQDSAGGVTNKVRLKMHGTAPKSPQLEAATVNGNLVQLVGRLSSTTVDHFEKLYVRQDNVIDALLAGNRAMAEIIARPGDAEGERSPAVAMAEARMSRLVEVGIGAAITRLTGGSPPGAGSPGPDLPLTGKHAELRAFIASQLTDDEIDSIFAVVISAGISEKVLSALGPENLSRALAMLQKT